MQGLFKFMGGSLGRVTRVVLGLALVYAGLALIGGIPGTVVALVGLVPLVMGVWGPCLFEAAAHRAHRV